MKHGETEKVVHRGGEEWCHTGVPMSAHVAPDLAFPVQNAAKPTRTFKAKGRSPSCPLSSFDLSLSLRMACKMLPTRLTPRNFLPI